ncbi:hypothetical protein LCGC14_1291150, partial [marine sediment metagenome]
MTDKHCDTAGWCATCGKHYVVLHNGICSVCSTASELYGPDSKPREEFHASLREKCESCGWLLHLEGCANPLCSEWSESTAYTPLEEVPGGEPIGDDNKIIRITEGPSQPLDPDDPRLKGVRLGEGSVGLDHGACEHGALGDTAVPVPGTRRDVNKIIDKS